MVNIIVTIFVVILLNRVPPTFSDQISERYVRSYCCFVMVILGRLSLETQLQMQLDLSDSLYTDVRFLDKFKSLFSLNYSESHPVSNFLTFRFHCYILFFSYCWTFLDSPIERSLLSFWWVSWYGGNLENSGPADNI